MDRQFWKSVWITKTEAAAFPCPTCERGALQVKANSFEWADSAESKRESEEHDDVWYPGEGVMSCVLVCSQKSCRESVACAGIYEDVETDRATVVTCGEPRFFHASLNLFHIPATCPDDVADEVRAAFRLFFCDHPSVLNHLRKAAELIMDHLKILKRRAPKPTKTTDRHYHYLSLGERIRVFQAKNPTVAAHLNALRVLGNEGSHSTKKPTKDDVFDAFDLIEFFIQEHFEKRGKKIVALVTTIGKHKKPRSRIKRRNPELFD